jgi:hypothetical protein
VGRGAIALLVRGELRRRVGAYVGVALVVALGGGAGLAAAIAADRTNRAYPDYVEEAEVTPLVVNPSIASRSVDELIRTLPGVRSVHSDAIFLASSRVAEPVTFAEFLSAPESWLQVRGSYDGRYIEVDRPIVRDGRLPTGREELFVSDDYRRDLERNLGRPVAIGDVVDLSFWWGFAADSDSPPDEIVRPIGVEQLRVVGFGHLPDEVLPDELYPRQRLIVSSDIAARYDCLGDLGPDMTLEEATLSATPLDCARQYRYYSLGLEPDARPSAISDAFNAATEDLNAEIPEVLREDIGYYFVTQDRTDLDHAVRQTTRPTVVSLVVFAVLAALATLTVTALAVARILQRGERDQLTHRAFGLRPRERAAVVAAVPLLAGAVGIVVAVAIAWVSSRQAPIGSVRAIVPEAGFSLPFRVAGPAVAALAFSFVVVTALVVLRHVARGTSEERRPLRTGRLLALTGQARGGPASTEGVRSAIGARSGAGGRAVLGGCVVALATIVGAVVFGATLTAVVDTPDRYGWPWDVSVITGGGYGDTVADRVTADLDDDPDVSDYAFFALDASSRVGDEIVPTIFGFEGSGGTELPLVRGRLAEGPGEALIGAITADDLDLTVGERVAVDSTIYEVGEVEIVGVAVLPSLGPFIADRTGLGSGLFVVVGDGADTEFNPATLTGIRLRDGVDPHTYLRRLGDDVLAWDAQGWAPQAHGNPVRSPEIVNADNLRAGPVVLGVLLALGLVAALALTVAQSVRDRRRDLAVLRTLGFSGRDLRATVRWQAATIVVIGIFVGVPLGLVIGRLTWRSYADALGLVPDADLPVLWLIVVLALLVAVVLASASLPARAAARVSPSETMRAPNGWRD